MIPRKEVVDAIMEFEDNTIFELEWASGTIIIAQKLPEGWKVLDGNNFGKGWEEKPFSLPVKASNLNVNSGADAKYIISHGPRIDW